MIKPHIDHDYFFSFGKTAEKIAQAYADNQPHFQFCYNLLTVTTAAQNLVEFGKYYFGSLAEYACKAELVTRFGNDSVLWHYAADFYNQITHYYFLVNTDGTVEYNMEVEGK